MTYLAIAGNAATPFYATVGDISGNWGGGNGGWVGPLVLAGVSQIGANFFSGNTIVAPMTGTYYIAARANVHEQHGGLNAGLRLANYPRAPFAGTVSAEAINPRGSCEIAFSCLMLMNVNESAILQAYQSWGLSSSSFYIAFIPTPDNRK